MQQLYYDAKNLLSCYKFFKMGQLITFADPEGAGVLTLTPGKITKLYGSLAILVRIPWKITKIPSHRGPPSCLGEQGKRVLFQGKRGTNTKI